MTTLGQLCDQCLAIHPDCAFSCFRDNTPEGIHITLHDDENDVFLTLSATRDTVERIHHA